MSLALIIRIAALDQSAITPAIRLVAALAIRGPTTELKAIKLARVQAKVWEKIKPELGKIIEFKGGRVQLPDDLGLDELDLTLVQSVYRSATLKPPKDPTDPRIIALVERGVDVDKATKTAGYLIRTYGEPIFNAAFKALIQKTPPPLEPLNYLTSCARGIILNAPAASGSNINARRVKRQISVANPEAARTEFIGWEAPIRIDGETAVYQAGTRRMIYRQRSGKVEIVEAKAGSKIPEYSEDCGIIIED